MVLIEVGWLFQQLLKLSGEEFTEMKDYIVIDSDTLFVEKTSFKKDGKYIFFTNEEWHWPYFTNFEKIFGYKVKSNLSLTSHMMIFNHDKLREMKKELETKHEKKWYDVYISTSSAEYRSCISDYDTYANWMICNHSEIVESIPLYNKGLSRNLLNNYDSLIDQYSNKYKTISFHSLYKVIDFKG